MTSTGILESTTFDAPFGAREGGLQAKAVRPGEAGTLPGADTRVLDYVARAPLTYPVPFNLLPPKWPKRK
jgi:hypothetical protein